MVGEEGDGSGEWGNMGCDETRGAWGVRKCAGEYGGVRQGDVRKNGVCEKNGLLFEKKWGVREEME